MQKLITVTSRYIHCLCTVKIISVISSIKESVLSHLSTWSIKRKKEMCLLTTDAGIKKAFNLQNVTATCNMQHGNLMRDKNTCNILQVATQHCWETSCSNFLKRRFRVSKKAAPPISLTYASQTLLTVHAPQIKSNQILFTRLFTTWITSLQYYK